MIIILFKVIVTIKIIVNKKILEMIFYKIIKLKIKNLMMIIIKIT
jgi:hypothetical protein